MPYVLKPTEDFLAELAKLDKSIFSLVTKKLDKLEQVPQLSKPLEHYPGFYSERVKNYRIVFKIHGNEVILYHIKKREVVYLDLKKFMN